jgi:hypothetical protein
VYCENRTEHKYKNEVILTDEAAGTYATPRL